MDLWTPEVQEAVLKLIVALLGIVATWATVKAKNWLVAAEAKALAEAREKGGAMLEQAVRLGIQYAEQVASKQVAKWTNEDKLNAAVEFVQVRFPEVPAEEIDRMIDAVIKDVKAWWLEQHPDSAAGGGAQ